MTSPAIFAWRVSLGIHAALLLAAALVFSGVVTSQPQVSLQAGDLTIEGSFSLADVPFSPTSTIFYIPPSAPPSERAEPENTVQPSSVEIRPASMSISRRFVSAELPLSPSLPAEVEVGQESVAPEVESPERETRHESDQSPLPASHLDLLHPVQRASAAVSFTVSTEVELPSSPGRRGTNVDELPRKLATNRPPPYPSDAYRRGLQGKLLLEVCVNSAGAVESLRVIESSGVESLDRSALETVTTWRFEPARLGGRPVDAIVNVPIRFAIRS